MSNERFQALTDEQLDWIDSACSDLEESWKRGEPSSIEQRCADAGPAVQPYLLRELLAAEIEMRRSRGELPNSGDYESRFPEHVEQIQHAFGFAAESHAAPELTQIIAYDDTGQSVVGDQVGKRPATLSRTIALDSRHDVLPRRFGRYKLQKLLGRGGMGSVYLAHDQELDRDVAIKFPEFDDRPEFKAVAIERFRREARAMAALHHANLCPVYDVGQFDGRHYLTMAYVEGQSLSDAKLSQAEIINTVSIIARALQSAHEAGIVHRDLKPSNVMLNSRGEPIVMDFGLASRHSVSESGLTHSGLIIGSPAYMAPEQVNAEHDRVGPRTDVYALGVILYQLLTRHRPFEGAGLSVLGQITSGQRPAPMSKLANVNPRLEAICLKAMEHRIENRYQSAAELAVALDEYASEPEAPARRISRSLGQTLWNRPRRKLLMAVIALAGVVLLGEIVLSLKTMNGEVIVELPDDLPAEVKKQIKIEVSRDGDVSVADEANGWRIGTSAGKYDIQLRGGGDQVEIHDKQVTVTRRKQTIVRVTMKVGEVQTAKTTNKNPPANSNKLTHAGAYSWPKDAPAAAIAPFDTAQAQAHQKAWADHFGVPVVYTNSIGMKFVLIPPGEFTMGSTPEEMEAALSEVSLDDKHWQECIKSEAPQHKVILTHPMYLGVYEVTQAEYEKVMGVNPSHFAPMGMGKEIVAGFVTADHPVERVGWNDAAEFCARLSTLENLEPFYLRVGEMITPLEGTGYRLPSEAEWEFACRAGTTTKYWTGDSDEDLAGAGWFGKSSGTHAKGSLNANAFGLYDMHGNVWEWVQDGWDSTWYSQFETKLAINPGSPSFDGSQRVMRGGNWYYPVSSCRSSDRRAFNPTTLDGALGFRVSLEVEAVKVVVASKDATLTAPTTQNSLP